MSTNLSDSLVSAEEIPVSRRFRWSGEQIDRALEAGILRHRSEADDRITLDQYHQLGEADILTTLDRVELLGGWLVSRMTIHPPHRASTFNTHDALVQLGLPGCFVDQNAPVTMPVSGTEPEPDVLVVRGRSGDFSDHHPGPRDVALLVEVSDSSLSGDRTIKKRLYATDRVAVYWIVNLQTLRIEVYTEPSGPGESPDYARCDLYVPGDSVPVILDGREVGRIAVSDLLP